MKDKAFYGFAPETFDFLWGIRLNNNREWFLEHKQQYVDYLYEPMKALGAEIYRPFSDMPGLLCKVSRIYKDMRMPQPNGPYKESLWISIRRDCAYWGDHPCLYFEIRPEAANYGFIHWKPQGVILERFRKDLVEHPNRFREIVEYCEKTTGMPFGGEEYKRRRPVDDPAIDRFINRKQFWFERSVAPSEELFSPELAQRVAQDLKNLQPVFDYFTALEAEAE